jgi:hypothetical protein
MASTYLTRTQSTATSDKIGTFSAWIKACDSNFAIFSGHTDSNNRIALYLNETLRIYGAIGGSQSVYFITNRVFRDPSAWYHIVVAWDTSQGTDTNRFKIYVNGVQETSFSTAAYPSVDADVYWNKGTTSIVGARFISAIQNYLNGSMANVEFVDGQQLTPAYFGSTDSTTGIWTPQASSTISSYGTNGFKLKMDTATPGADTSGNTNTFTVGGGTPTLTQGSPSNVFATFNPLDVNLGTVTTFSNGNTTVMHNAGSSGSTTAARSTLAYSAGKFYWETKCIASGGDVRTGIISMSSTDYNTQTNPFTLNECYNYKSNGDKGSWGDANSAYGATYTAGDIIGIAHDVSAGTLIFYKNGVSQGTAFTGLSTSLFWGAFSSEYNQGKYSYNFGEGFFGTTAAGTQADDNGQGLFAYDVPAGYYALNTKNLEAYG